jgi:hypothetical protein
MLPIWEQVAKGYHSRFGIRSRREGTVDYLATDWTVFVRDYPTW